MTRGTQFAVAAVLGFGALYPAGASARPAAAATAAAATPPESAAPAPDAVDDKKEQARPYFEKGIALFEEEAWDAAYVEFMRSRELFPTRAATKDAALCLRKLHRFDEALDLFEALLREFPNLPPDDHALAERSVRELSALVGQLEIRDAEAGASVVVDGRLRGNAPLPPVRVNAGTHLVRVAREGFLPFEAQVVVVGGQATALRAKLGALTQGGRLRVVEESARHALVLVDNAEVGEAPWEGTLPLGEHTVVLRGSGNLGTQPALAPVRLNQLTPLTLSLEELRATLRVEPSPPGARLAIDGVTVGRGVWQGPLRAGRHRVEVASDGFLPLTRELTLTSDAREVLSAQLERDPASALWRAANPPRFFLELNGSAALAPSFGGELLASCGTGCTHTRQLGILALAGAGYRFSSGLELAVQGGFLSTSTRYSGRRINTTPRGLEAAPGTADDDLRLSGVVAGVAAGLHRGTRFPLSLRIGAGVLLGSVTDRRRGSATAPERVASGGTTIPELPFSFDVSESPSATFAYLAPEARAGIRFGTHWELNAGVALLILVGVSHAEWQDRRPFVPAAELGEVSFGQQTLVGSPLLVIVPGVAGRYEF